MEQTKLANRHGCEKSSDFCAQEKFFSKNEETARNARALTRENAVSEGNIFGKTGEILYRGGRWMEHVSFDAASVPFSSTERQRRRFESLERCS